MKIIEFRFFQPTEAKEVAVTPRQSKFGEGGSKQFFPLKSSIIFFLFRKTLFNKIRPGSYVDLLIGAYETKIKF